MPYPEQHFRWTWDFKAPREALWPLVSNTDRFNRDCGYPAVTLVPPVVASSAASATPFSRTAAADRPLTNIRRLRASVLGIVVEWDELAFEWEAPSRFAVERIYHRGPLAKMLLTCELAPRSDGGTALVYNLRLMPASLLGAMSLPYSIGRRWR